MIYLVPSVPSPTKERNPQLSLNSTSYIVQVAQTPLLASCPRVMHLVALALYATLTDEVYRWGVVVMMLSVVGRGVHSGDGQGQIHHVS